VCVCDVSPSARLFLVGSLGSVDIVPYPDVPVRLLMEDGDMTFFHSTVVVRSLLANLLRPDLALRLLTQDLKIHVAHLVGGAWRVSSHVFSGHGV
jgi:hypothetical protein